MNIEYYRNQQFAKKKRINDLRLKVNDENGHILRNNEQIQKLKRSMNTNPSISSIKSKQMQIDRYEKDTLSRGRKVNRYQNEIIQKEKELDNISKQIQRLEMEENRKINEQHTISSTSSTQRSEYSSERPVTSIDNDAIFGKNNYPIINNQVFLISPFSEAFSNFDENILKPLIESIPNVKYVRADDLYTPGVIMELVWKLICESPVIVADLSGKNINVFYELGLAHAIGKKVIMITQDMDNVPFDLRHLGIIEYSRPHKGKPLAKKTAEKLKNAIIDILNDK